MKVDLRPMLAPPLLAALLLSGCGAAAVAPLGRMTDEAFEHATYDYRIRYDSASEGRLMPAEWILSNYTLTEGGATGEPKIGPRHLQPMNIDVNGDGEDDEREDVYIHDLLFRHRYTGASLWVRTVVTSRLLYERELRVIVRDYIDGLAGASNASVSFDDVASTERQHRMAAHLLHEGAGELAGSEAYISVIDVVNLDQRELTREAVAERTRVVVLRPQFGWTANLGGGAPSPEELDEKPFFPVFLTIGYSSRPEDFEYHRADYESLLARLEVGSLVDMSSLREPVFECVPELDAMAIDVVTNTEGLPITLGEDPRWSDAARECITRAVRAMSFPPSESPRSYGAVFRREETVNPPPAVASPAYGNPGAPPPEAD